MRHPVPAPAPRLPKLRVRCSPAQSSLAWTSLPRRHPASTTSPQTPPLPQGLLQDPAPPRATAVCTLQPAAGRSSLFVPSPSLGCCSGLAKVPQAAEGQQRWVLWMACASRGQDHHLSQSHGIDPLLLPPPPPPLPPPRKQSAVRFSCNSQPPPLPAAHPPFQTPQAPRSLTRA